MNSRSKTLAAQFAEVKRIASEKGYSDELLSLLNPLHIGHATTTLMLSLRHAVRARKLMNGFTPNNISELMLPQPHQVAYFGRANFPFRPMLYFSDSELTVIKEVSGSVGDRIGVINLSLATGRPNPNVFIIGELIHRSRTKRSMLAGEHLDLVRQLKDLGLDTDLAIQIDGFYADVFKGKGAEFYPLTAAIAQHFLLPEWIAGIVYPSVAGSTGFNAAFKPEAALRHIAVTAAKIIHLERKVGNTFKARVENSSQRIESDGTIVWA